jgi:hypothetical protein
LTELNCQCFDQGDKIGQILAFLAIVYFGQGFLKISEVAQISGLLFVTVKVTH